MSYDTKARQKKGTEQFWGNGGQNPIDRDLLLIAKANKNMIPNGMLKEIGILHKVSRERVRQRAKVLGLISPHQTTRILFTKPCKNCGTPNFRKLFCNQKCHYEYSRRTNLETRKCKIDGVEFTCYKYELKSFCSKKCKGIAQRKYKVLDMLKFTYEDLRKTYPKITNASLWIVTKNWVKEGLIRKDYFMDGNYKKVIFYKI